LCLQLANGYRLQVRMLPPQLTRYLYFQRLDTWSEAVNTVAQLSKALWLRAHSLVYLAAGTLGSNKRLSGLTHISS
jgi:hypothetical protein